MQEFRYIIEPEAAASRPPGVRREQMAEISRACDDMGTARFLSERTEADTRFHVAILAPPATNCSCRSAC